jgi:hypothetical protein
MFETGALQLREIESRQAEAQGQGWTGALLVCRLGEVDQLFTAGGHQPAGLAHGTQVVLLKQRGRFLQAMLQHLGRFQLLKALAPMVLPVQGETAEGKHAQPDAGQGAIGSPVKARQQRRATGNLPTGEGSLDQLQGAGLGAGGLCLTAQTLLVGSLPRQVGGDQGLCSALRK